VRYPRTALLDRAAWHDAGTTRDEQRAGREKEARADEDQKIQTVHITIDAQQHVSRSDAVVP